MKIKEVKLGSLKVGAVLADGRTVMSAVRCDRTTVRVSLSDGTQFSDSPSALVSVRK